MSISLALNFYCCHGPYRLVTVFTCFQHDMTCQDDSLSSVPFRTALFHLSLSSQAKSAALAISKTWLPCAGTFPQRDMRLLDNSRFLTACIYSVKIA